MGRNCRLPSEAEWEYAACAAPRPSTPCRLRTAATISRAKRLPTALIVAVSGPAAHRARGPASRQRRSQASQPMRGGCTTCTATSWSGWRIAGMTATVARPRMGRRGLMRKTSVLAVFVCGAAGAGTAMRTSRARPTASGSTRAAGTSALAFGWCVRPHLQTLTSGAAALNKSE